MGRKGGVSFFDELLKVSKNDYAGYIDTCDVYKVPYCIDSGNFLLNGIICGDLYGGIPAGKIGQFSGEKSAGKSFAIINMIVSHLKKSKNHAVMLFETEGALVTEMNLGESEEDVKISEGVLNVLTEEECKRFMVFPVQWIEKTTTEMENILKQILTNPKYEGWKFSAYLDSLGMMQSIKQGTDIADGVQKKDMTKQQAIKSMFTTITMPLAKLHIPLIFANHVYQAIGAWKPTKVEGGGAGQEFSPSYTIRWEKSKLNDSNKINIGSKFKLTVVKSRFVAENAVVEIESRYSIGMDRYSGLWAWLEAHNLIEKVSHGNKGTDFTIKGLNKTTTSVQMKAMKSKEEFFTKEVLDFMNEEFKRRYKLRMSTESSSIIEETNGQDTTTGEDA